MKKLFFLLLVISFCSSLSAKTNYHWTRMPGNDGGYVSCMTADKNGTIYAGSNALFTSTDEGETWNKIYDNFSPNNIVNLVITDSVIFANIVINECDVDEYVIYLSKDNGKTWAVDSNKNDNNIFNKKILTFGNTYYEISGNSILKSIDAGSSWIALDSTNNYYGGNNQMTIDKKGNLIYFFGNDSNKIRKYDPIANKITILPFDTSKFAFGIQNICIDSLNNYYLGFYSTTNDFVCYSKDEGKTWKGAGFKYNIWDMIVQNNTNLIVYSQKNEIFLTTNFGVSWNKTPSSNIDYGNFFLSPKGNLFMFRTPVLKFENGRWIPKYTNIDNGEITSLAENNNQLYCSSNGINTFNTINNKWESYFIDSNKKNNQIYNFVISGNNFIAINADSIITSNIATKHWSPKPPRNLLNGWCKPPSDCMISSFNETISFSNKEGIYSYISDDFGDNWTDLSQMLDSSEVLSNIVDKNGFIFLAKHDNPNTPDSIKASIIVSMDKGKSWQKTNYIPGNSWNISLALDISNNAIAIDQNIFYKYNYSNNIWDTLYISPIGNNRNVLFINNNLYIAVTNINHTSINKALVVDIISGRVDTVVMDYHYLNFEKLFNASDGTIYAATDRGVFKLEITTDVEPITGSDNQINIYPNPANDLINICYQNSENIKSIKIINQLGEIVYDNDIIPSGNYIQINTKEFSSGIYYCIIKLQNRTVSQKFVIVR